VQVLIMHGLADEIIDIQQAMALHRKLGKRSVMPLFITGAGHNNLECYTEFTTRLREFLVHVQPAGPEVRGTYSD
jgi:pimeloyl-ACP methyl ester carboxylesterase